MFHSFTIFLPVYSLKLTFELERLRRQTANDTCEGLDSPLREHIGNMFDCVDAAGLFGAKCFGCHIW